MGRQPALWLGLGLRVSGSASFESLWAGWLGKCLGYRRCLLWRGEGINVMGKADWRLVVFRLGFLVWTGVIGS